MYVHFPSISAKKLLSPPIHPSIKSVLLKSVAALPLLQLPRTWVVKVKPSLVKARPFLQH